MTADLLMLLVANALVGDAGLQAWCQTTFGQGLHVFVGVDEHNPPARQYWPLVALVDITEMKSDEQKYQKFAVVLGSGVVNETVTTAGLLQSYAGILQAEELRGKVESVLFAANIGHSVETAGDSAAASSHPYYISYSAVSFSLLKTSRRAVR